MISREVPPHKGESSCHGRYDNKPKVMLVEDVEDEWTDEYVEDAEGVKQEEDHGSTGLEVALCLGEDGDVLALEHHECGGYERD